MKKRITLLAFMLCSLLAPAHIQAMRECDDSDDEIMAALDEARITAQPLSPDEVTTLFSHGTNYRRAAQTNASRTGGYVDTSGVVVSGLQSASRNNRQLHYLGQVNGMVRIDRLMQPIMSSAQDTLRDQLTWAQDPYRYKELPTSPMTAIERSELKTLTEDFDLGCEYATNRILLAKALDEKCERDFINKILKKASDQYDYYLMKKALEHGADPNIKSDVSFDPIIMHAKSVAIVKLLVDNGASMKTITLPNKNTVLHQACDGRYEPAVLKYYIQNAGLDINSENYDHETPLHAWVNNVSISSPPDAQKKLTHLLAAGADCMRKNRDNETALDWIRSHATAREHMRHRWQILDDHLPLYKSYADQMMNAAGIAQHAKIITERQAKMEPQLSCIICTDEFELDPSLDTITLPCAHIFHTICIGAWFKTITNCPVCRTPIK